MAKKLIEVELITQYTIEVDTESIIVKEYLNEDDLINDLASYRFNDVLPVINSGVEIKDITVLDWSSKEI